MLISLSRVSRGTSNSFVKVIATIAASEETGFQLSPDVEAVLPAWIKAGETFVSKFELDQDAYADVATDLRRGRVLAEDQDMVDAAIDLAQSLRQAIKTSIANENAVSREELALIKNFNTIALSDRDETRARALASLKKNISHLHDPTLSAMFNAEVGDQGSVLQKLERVTQRLGGQGTSIDQKIRTKHKGTELLKRYNKLRSELNAVPKNFVMNLVRSSGKKYLPVRKVYDELHRAGIKVHTVPAGYSGMVDDQLRYYTTEGLVLNGTPAGDVRMNPQYDPKKDNTYVCEAQAPMAKNFSRIYTESYKSRSTKSKFAKVASFDKKAPALRRKWLREFKADGVETLNGTLAMLCELVYQTSGRIGGTSNKTDGASTYGLSTLLVGHYKKRGGSRVLEYSGKKAQTQKHKLVESNPTQKLLIQALDSLAKDKTRKERLMTHGHRSISASMVNKYLKSIGMPAGVTVHKFRTLKGTQLARSILEKSPLRKRKNLNSTQVSKWLKSALSKVAKELGHFSNGNLTINTAIANYIDPSILEEFYSDIGIRMPANIEKQARMLK